MAKKIYLSPSSQDANMYASGNTNEQEQCRKISKYCAEYLKKAGFEVKNGAYGTMYSRTEESNKWGADLHIPIHTNAYNGKITGGTQIYMAKLNGEHKKVGQAILDRLAPITVGSSHEKLVANNEFYEINQANAITVYCECEFHDTKAGADCIRNNVKAIGEAIAKGVCDYYGVALPTETKTPTKTETTSSIKKGDLVSIKKGAKYYTGKSVPTWVLNTKWYVVSVSGDKAIIDKSDDGKLSINSPINVSYLTVVKKTATPTIKVGSTVKVKKGAKTYDGKKLASFVYSRKHKVKELKGDRAVITYLGITVCAINVKNLSLVK